MENGKIVRICFTVIIVTPLFIRVLNFAISYNGMEREGAIKVNYTKTLPVKCFI